MFELSFTSGVNVRKLRDLTDTEYFASVLCDSQMYPGEPINVLGTVRIHLR